MIAVHTPVPVLQKCQCTLEDSCAHYERVRAIQGNETVNTTCDIAGNELDDDRELTTAVSEYFTRGSGMGYFAISVVFMALALDLTHQLACLFAVRSLLLA